MQPEEIKQNMKWFKHETDAHTNLKLQAVVDKHGLEGYGFYWACVELIGLQGENFRVEAQKCWQSYLKKVMSIDVDKQNIILQTFCEVNLIDKKAFKYGHLYIPKMEERSDDYTARLRRVSEQTTDNVHLEENRKEKKKKEKKRTEYTQDFESFWNLYPKKTGKAKAFDYWQELTSEEKKKIMEDIPNRKQDDKWVNGFIKDPERYIKHRQWEDDIIKPRGKVEPQRKVDSFKK